MHSGHTKCAINAESDAIPKRMRGSDIIQAWPFKQADNGRETRWGWKRLKQKPRSAGGHRLTGKSVMNTSTSRHKTAGGSFNNILLEEFTNILTIHSSRSMAIYVQTHAFKI